MIRRLIAQPLASARTRLEASGLLAFELIAGAVLLVIAILAFGEIADQVIDAEGLARFDNVLASWLHLHMGAALTELMVHASALHSITAVSGYVVLFAIVLAAQRDWYRLRLLIAIVPVGMLLNVLMKQIFQRTRPSFSDMTDQLATYSFPSGHTMAATVLWGFIVMWVWPRLRSWPARVLLLTLACVAVLLVGFSRMYLGAHFLSDVLAAMCEGVAWSALCGIAFSAWRRNRRIATAG